MKYREKSEIIEAVKWDGKLETIEKNELLEYALKDEKIIVAVDKLTDKECTILMRYFGGSYEKVKLGEYIVKREREEGYEMKHVEAEEFEERFEVLSEIESTHCLSGKDLKIELEINKESLHKKEVRKALIDIEAIPGIELETCWISNKISVKNYSLNVKGE